MSTASKAADTPAEPVVLAIDVGGSHVKILLSSGGEERRDKSGPDMTAKQMVDKVKALAAGLHYDVIAMGYPGPVHHNKPLVEPANLGKGWVGCDFAASFGKPTKVVNDALMQAVGSYEGGRMLFLGLGTGLGAAMIVENVAQPMELALAPFGLACSRDHFFEQPPLTTAILQCGDTPHGRRISRIEFTRFIVHRKQ